MNTIYLPFIANTGPKIVPGRKRLGVGIKSQSQIPTSVTLEKLGYPIYYNWGPWALPGWQGEIGQLHTYGHPQFQPMSWNPPEDLPTGEPPDMAQTWMVACVQANLGKPWLIGNEPVEAAPPFRAWCPVEWMTWHCVAFSRHHNVKIIPFGGIAMHDSDYAYGDSLRSKLREAGVEPEAYHWHIYPDTVERFTYYLERVLVWSAGLPVIISETNFWWGSAGDNRRLMDLIVDTLDRRQEVLAVYWYVNWEPNKQDLPNTWQLLDRDNASCELTETGRHYLEVTA